MTSQMLGIHATAEYALLHAKIIITITTIYAKPIASNTAVHMATHATSKMLKTHLADEGSACLPATMGTYATAILVDLHSFLRGV